MLNKFSLSAPQKMYREQYGEYVYWCWGVKGWCTSCSFLLIIFSSSRINHNFSYLGIFIFIKNQLKWAIYYIFSENEQVDFKHLMSMGYQRDWLQEQKQKTEEEKGEKKVSWIGSCLLINPPKTSISSGNLMAVVLFVRTTLGNQTNDLVKLTPKKLLKVK